MSQRRRNGCLNPFRFGPNELAAVERWATRLGRGYAPERRARVEAFVASAGATQPADEPAYEVFGRDVGFYVYLLSRTSLGVQAKGETLEALVREHLSRGR